MLVPMIAAMLIQAGLLSGMIFFGGIKDELENNAFAIMSERVEGRKTDLQSNMLQRWSRLSGAVENIGKIVDASVGEGGGRYENLTVNSPFTEQVMEEVSGELIYLLRRNGTTGAFVIFEGGEEGPHERAGLYIRDNDPTSSEEGTADLLLERAPAALSRRLRIPTDIGWNPCFIFETENTAGDYYFKPFLAAREHPDAHYSALGYWAEPFRLWGDNSDIVTYTVPLVANGKPYGVMGVELSVDYLRTQLPYGELFSRQNGAYFLGVTGDGGESFAEAAISGPLYRRLFGARSRTLELDGEVREGFYSLKLPSGGKQVYGCVKYLDLYGSNTPFDDGRWALVGITEADTLLGFSRWVRKSIFAALVFSVVIGLGAVVLASQLFSRPVVSLVRQMKTANPSGVVKLQKTGIFEIDEMADAIETLSGRVAESASRISKIIELSGVPIGVFEAYKDGTVFCSERFRRLMRLDGVGEALSTEEFWGRLDALSVYIESGDLEGRSALYAFPPPRASWISLRVVEDAERYLGIAADVTRETQEKRRIEYERDYDLLTGLLNRRAFRRRMEVLLAEPAELATGVLIMLDLDNLKYVNDTYGHDFGDEYIRCAAAALKWFTQFGAVASRLSGDEFCVFLYGYESRESARGAIRLMRDRIAAESLSVPGEGSLRVRASGGGAWFPDDARQLDELIRCADYAMYKMKNNSKGEFTEFDRVSYEKESYILQGSESLNVLIENRLLEFYFQPIVDVTTGEPFGYEALMRSRVKEIRSPLEILTLARAQSKLNQIERLTWFCALEAFAGKSGFQAGCRLFINSIPSQLLSLEDVEELETRFGPYLSRVVMEFTEEERIDEDLTEKKRAMMKRWNGQLALDDYGTGYNGDAILLELTPDFVKADISFVRDIDKSIDKQKLVRNLVSYARERGIRIIAEGVETKGELETLISLGADYLQGYYLGRPAPGPAEVPREVRREIEEAVRGRRQADY